MIEKPSGNKLESKEAAQVERMRIVGEMIENGEEFHFPGIRTEVYDKIKIEQEEYPGYTTPIDDLLARFKFEGMKLVAGKYKTSRDVMVLPQGSDDVHSDFLLLKNLDTEGDIDRRLRELIDFDKV
jgi:hypothetical protein